MTGSGTFILLTLALLFGPADATEPRPTAAADRIDPRIAVRPKAELYWRVPIAGLALNKHTHVCVAGKVTRLYAEKDGDAHWIVEDAGAKVVAEIIPTARPLLGRPKVGQSIVICGVTRFDREHAWEEIHPVESWWAVP